MAELPTLEQSISLWRAPLESTPRFTGSLVASEMQAALGVLFTSYPYIDSPELTQKVVGRASGMQMLAAVLWAFGQQSLDEPNAILLVSLLLDRGADPNASVNGYAPADIFIESLYHARTPANECLGLANVLVAAGMDANQAGHYDKSARYVKISTLPNNEIFTHVLFDGPLAIELGEATHPVALKAARRTL